MARTIVRRPRSCLSSRGALAVLIPDVSISNTLKVQGEIQEMLDMGLPITDVLRTARRAATLATTNG